MFVLLGLLWVRVSKHYERESKAELQHGSSFQVLRLSSPVQNMDRIEKADLNTVNIIPSNSVQLHRDQSFTSDQALQFDSLMRELYQSQASIPQSNQVIIYHVNKESGLGNVIIGLVSCLFAALATNRGLQSRSISAIFSNLSLWLFYSKTFPSLLSVFSRFPPIAVGFDSIHELLRLPELFSICNSPTRTSNSKNAFKQVDQKAHPPDRLFYQYHSKLSPKSSLSTSMD